MDKQATYLKPITITGNVCLQGLSTIFCKVLKGTYALSTLMHPTVLVCNNETTEHTFMCMYCRKRDGNLISDMDVFLFCERHQTTLLNRPNIVNEISNIMRMGPMTQWFFRFRPLLTNHPNFRFWTHKLMHAISCSTFKNMLAQKGIIPMLSPSIDPVIDYTMCEDQALYSAMINRYTCSAVPINAGEYTSGLVQAVFAIGIVHNIPMELLFIIFELTYGIRITVQGVDNAIKLCRVKLRLEEQSVPIPVVPVVPAQVLSKPAR